MTAVPGPERTLSQSLAVWILTAIALSAGTFLLYTAWTGPYPALIQRSIMLGTALALVFLGRIAMTEPAGIFSKLWVAVLWVMALTGLGICAFVVINYQAIAESEGRYGPFEVILGTILIVVLLTASWLSFGPALGVVAILFLLYALYGREMPDLIAHRGLNWRALASSNLLTTRGIFGLPLGVVADVIVYFLIFSAFLAATGASNVFIRLAQALVGGLRGGPAKIAVVGSGLMGTISGSAVANVAASGTFTIPMMRHAGYRRRFAGAVEAVASSGGQLMPPVMGAAVFIMADMLGTGYGTIMLAALVPALIFYANLFLVVDLEAGRLGLRGSAAERRERAWTVMRQSGFLLIPLGVLFSLVMMQYSPRYAALVALGVLLALSLLTRATRLTPWLMAEALVDGMRATAPIAVAVAVAGIVVGVVETTGVGINLSAALSRVAGDSLLLLLVLTMIASIILGMGLPTVACYIILALIIAPILIRLGVPPISAHLFVFYFGILSAITPPVALASFAAAGISGSSPLRTSVTSLKLALPAFFMPYLFVLQPELLFQGELLPMLAPVASALIAIVGISAATIGHFRGHVSLPRRALFLLGGCMVFAPNYAIAIPGAALIALAIGIGEMARRNAPHELPQSGEDAENKSSS
ncbi:MAG: TRAP transporter fused permease subunit [Pararhodobacter sp.]|nr:TRAP transporter fused permease subunit [Pararhodobacter sp.]